MKKYAYILALLLGFISCEQESFISSLDENISLEKKANKVTICHLTGNGTFHMINVNENALSAHLAHGDGIPGECYDVGSYMGADCVVIDVSGEIDICDGIDNNCNGTIDEGVNGLIGWYPFSGNANDESGNGNNGTVYGAILAEDRFGNPNMAYSYDGVNDYIEISDPTNLDIDYITIQAWVNLDDVSGYKYLINRDGEGSWGTRHFIFGAVYGNKKPRFYVWNNESSYTSIGGTTELSPGVWYHLAATFDGNNINIYTNGVLENSASLNGVINKGVQPIRLGRCEHPNYRYWFNGQIDEAAIYSRALTADEIKAHYETGLGCL